MQTPFFLIVLYVCTTLDKWTKKVVGGGPKMWSLYNQPLSFPLILSNKEIVYRVNILFLSIENKQERIKYNDVPIDQGNIESSCTTNKNLSDKETSQHKFVTCMKHMLSFHKILLDPLVFGKLVGDFYLHNLNNNAYVPCFSLSLLNTVVKNHSLQRRCDDG